jgi:methylmalonyl-CoA mutase C-terminal domain/subunit
VTGILKERQAEDIMVFGGGVIPEMDIPALLDAGIAAVFTPGTTTESVIQFIKEKCSR